MHIRKWKKDAFDVALNGALEGAFVSAIEDANEGSSEGTPIVVPWYLYTDAQEGAFEVEIKGTRQDIGFHKTIQ